MKNANEKSQEDLVKERNSAKVDSEEYQRAKDSIKDIRGDTNNIQIGDLSNVIKAPNEATRIIETVSAFILGGKISPKLGI